MSLIGTKRTCQDGLMMSVLEGRKDLRWKRRYFRVLTQRGRRDWFRAAAAEASAMLCQWEWLALFVGGGGIELLEAPLS
jgi:hypothetical protein